MTPFEILSKLNMPGIDLTTKSAEFDVGGKSLRIGPGVKGTFLYQPDKIVLKLSGSVPSYHLMPLVNVPIESIEFLKDGDAFAVGRFGGIVKRQRLVMQEVPSQ